MRPRDHYSLATCALAFVVCLVPELLPAQTVKLHVSSKAGDRLSAKPDLRFADARPAGGAIFEVNDGVRLQRIDGFGASIMEAGLMVLNTLPADKQEGVLRALFDPRDGAGYSAMKTPIAGTDFQSAGPWYTYDDTPDDVELKDFSVERDFGPNGVGTYILRASKYGHFALQSPMDYPPDAGPTPGADAAPSGTDSGSTGTSAPQGCGCSSTAGAFQALLALGALAGLGLRRRRLTGKT